MQTHTPATAEPSRARARRLESELDSKLVQLSRAEATGTAGPLVQEIERLLGELHEVNDIMSREAGDTPGGTATAMHKLQRHREILHDLQQEFSKSKAALKAATERSQLLSSGAADPVEAEVEVREPRRRGREERGGERARAGRADFVRVQP